MAPVLEFRKTGQLPKTVQIPLGFPLYSPVSLTNRFSLPAFRLRLPIHHGPIVDGRTGVQWTASVRDYLSWRSGRTWLPLARRFHPESLFYTEGLNTLNQAFRPAYLDQGAACACCYCMGAPFADERREMKAAA